MEILITFLAIGFFLVYISSNISKLDFAILVFSSILLFIIGVSILFSGDILLSQSVIESYSYVNGTLTSITTTPLASSSNYSNVLGIFTLLSGLYLYLLGTFTKK